MQAETPPVWLLADNRAGNIAQALGVIEALDVAYRRVDLSYTRWVQLPNLLRSDRLIGIDRTQTDGLVAPWPKLAVAAGRRAAPVMRWVKKQSGSRTRLVHIMRPEAGETDFDLIAVPEHDQVVPDDNILEVLVAPHRISLGKIKQTREIWTGRFVHLPRPWIAVIVGGSTKSTRFTPDMAGQLGQTVAKIVQMRGGSVLMTTSRRTGAEQTAVLTDAVADLPQHIFTWGDEGENPYLGYLACADAVVVTGDSVSMVSEACAATAPVMLFAPERLIPGRHRLFHEALMRAKLIQPLSVNWRLPERAPLRSADTIAGEIRKRWPELFS